MNLFENLQIMNENEENIEHTEVLKIENNVLVECLDANVKSVVIPNGVTKIGDYAFYRCEQLENVKIPNSVTTIGWSAFKHCVSLRNIEIPNSVTEIGDQAFAYSGLTSIDIPDGVTKLPAFVFGQCESLKNVTIPLSIKNIDKDAFWCSFNLEYINGKSVNEMLSKDNLIPLTVLGCIYTWGDLRKLLKK